MNKNIVTKKLIMYIAQHHAKRANNHKESNLVSYRLCGCTSGALIVVRQLTSLLLLKWGNQKNGHNNKIYSIYGISHGTLRVITDFSIDLKSVLVPGCRRMASSFIL